MKDFTHLDATGAARMVNVGAKPITARRARASGCVTMTATTWQMLHDGKSPKGSVLEVARVAGIMAAKRTGELIPLCHPLGLDAVAVDFQAVTPGVLHIFASVETTARTGVEMEALTAVTVAALTVYDMCKSADRTMCIEMVRLEEKSGGQSGDFLRDANGLANARERKDD